MASDQPPKNIDFPVQFAEQKIVHEKLFAEFERQGRKTMVASSHKQELADGPIKSVDIPTSWSRSSRYEDAVGSIVNFKPAAGKASLTSLEHNRPISEQAKQDFKKLLEENTATTKMLTPGQVRSLSEVLGERHMGDNQYTNPAKYPAADAPLFKLTNAQVMKVNGRNVLEVEGSFMDQNGQPTELYRGVFSPSGKDGNKVNEFFLAAPSREELVQQDSAYRKAIKSIEWR